MMRWVCGANSHGSYSGAVLVIGEVAALNWSGSHYPHRTHWSNLPGEIRFLLLPRCCDRKHLFVFCEESSEQTKKISENRASFIRRLLFFYLSKMCQTDPRKCFVNTATSSSVFLNSLRILQRSSNSSRSIDLFYAYYVWSPLPLNILQSCRSDSISPPDALSLSTEQETHNSFQCAFK